MNIIRMPGIKDSMMYQEIINENLVTSIMV